MRSTMEFGDGDGGRRTLHLHEQRELADQRAGTGDDVVIAACILAGDADRACLHHEARIRRVARVEQRLIATHAPGFRTDRQHPQGFDAQQLQCRHALRAA